MRTCESGTIGGVFRAVLIVLVVVGLLTAVLYLMSEINHRKYRLAPQGDTLVVQRGRLMPFGFAPFVPESEALRSAYESIPLPPGQRPDRPEVFDDRTDMDRALFSWLAGWARQHLDDPNPETFRRAVGYITRCELLPGLSEEQRQELRVLRGNLAYRNGHRLLESAVDALERALAEFKLSVSLGTSRATDADAWIEEIERRIAESRRLPQGAGAESPQRPMVPAPDRRPAPSSPGRVPDDPGKNDKTKPSAKWQL